MAKYTITIKTLLDNNFDFQMVNYPIFDENYRQTLNNNILYHYYENEIGFETAPLFRFYLNQKLNEIMPYYNELYKAQRKLINENLLLNNVNLTESLTGHNTKNDTNNGTLNTTSQNTSTSTSTNTGSSNSKNLFQDTPQGSISNTEINAQTWATNLTLDSNSTSNSISDNTSTSGTAQNTTTNTLNSTGTNDYIKTIIGNNGGKFNIDILNDIKNNLMNIDLMIINDLNDLFMQIF